MTETDYNPDIIPNCYSQELKDLIKLMLIKDLEERPDADALLDNIAFKKFFSSVCFMYRITRRSGFILWAINIWKENWSRNLLLQKWGSI